MPGQGVQPRLPRHYREGVYPLGATVAVQVPVEDREDLRELMQELGEVNGVVAAHPFDGEAIVQGVVVLTTATLPHFRAWLKARTEARKSYSVAVKGMKLTGYSADDVTKIVTAIENQINK